MVEKTKCLDCSNLIAKHLAICPFCNAKMKTQEEIDNDPAIKLALAKLSMSELEMQKQTPKKNKKSF